MTISRAQMYRQLYQNGGNTLPIYPRIEAIETSLGGAEERIGDPALGQPSGSPLSNVYNNQTSGTGIGSIFGNTGGQQSNSIQPGGAVDPIGFPQQPSMQQPIQPGPSVDPIRPIKGLGNPFTPQADPNKDYGFNQYGFDSDLLNYLNQQKYGSASDRGISYNYDPTNQMFSGGTFGAQYENIPLSVLQQVATSGDRNLLDQYQTGGRGFNQPSGNIFGIMNQRQQAPMQQFNYGGRAGYQEGGRIGYQEGGMGMDQMIPQMQEQMMQPQMQDPMMAQAPQIDPSQMDPKQALEIIIQMLIEQGIPPEQAREIAIQMVQAVAEGGMGEMSDERVEARFGGRIGYASGGIGSLVGRQGYFVGSIVKGITGAVKGVVKGVTGAVKKVVGSDLGKAALTIAAIYASGGGFSPQGFSFFGSQAGPGLLGSGGAFDLGSSYLGQGLFGTAGADTVLGAEGIGSQGFLGKLGLTSGYGAGANILSGASSLLPSKGTLAAFGLGTTLGGLLGEPPKREDFPNNEEYQKAVDQYKAQYQAAINNPNPQFAAGQFPNNPFYPQKAANGGRIGYQEGGITDLIKQVTQQEFFGRPSMAMGGEIPVRKNQVGVTELDYRKTGGFVPPIGIKEKADDIPAMLSNNEFVFTADAVRNAGEGNVNKGAQRMYGLMKQLEAGGVV